MKTVQAYRYRIDPTADQVAALSSHIGGSRFVYNHLLGLVKTNWDTIESEKKAAGDGTHATEYLSTSHFGLLYTWAAVRDEAAPWWAENSAQAYNDAASRLSRAFTAWRRGKSRFPVFKSKRATGSVKFCGTSFAVIDSHHVRLAKVGSLKTYESMRKLTRRLVNGTASVSSVTVKRESGGWFVVFTANLTRPDPGPRLSGDESRVIGLDLGLSTLVVGATPNGEQVLSVTNPRGYVRAQTRLGKAQKVASRRQGPRRGVAPSNRWRRANARVQAIHAHVANARDNLLHNTTTRLVKNYDVIVVEDLFVAGMSRNHRLAKHIYDASFGEFVRQLEYKAAWYGAVVVKADRFYPSSKTCSVCGAVKAKLSLSERMYCCETCGVHIDRDVNAATNLARLGITRPAGTDSVAGRGGNQKTPAPAGVEAGACETSTVPA